MNSLIVNGGGKTVVLHIEDVAAPPSETGKSKTHAGTMHVFVGVPFSVVVL